ncbi:hypothetical protein ACNOYE_17775 [Nannocystaceae bacterium ST9]
MYIVYLAMLVFAIVAGTINFGWDLTVRRHQARRLGARRRSDRPRALPPAPDPEQREGLLPSERTQAFIEHTRTTFAALDALIDRFDLLRLRARARARIGAAFVNVERPRRRATALLEDWLAAFHQLDPATLRQLEEVALGPATVAEVLARERDRASWEFRSDTEPTLADTTTDLDRAIIHMQQIVRILESGDDDPYRGTAR